MNLLLVLMDEWLSYALNVIVSPPQFREKMGNSEPFVSFNKINFLALKG